ncbi:MAG TPA: hypothetical protein VJ957_03900, partial [Longimicrobiales bacterium]|nr:hypothetical protein [Longimicrobiales bacterium]
MSRQMKADGKHWKVALDKHAPHPGTRAVVFHCLSDRSYGYRVVEVPAAEIASQVALDQMKDDEVAALYARSQPFDFVHDPKAHEDHIGVAPQPRHP